MPLMTIKPTKIKHQHCKSPNSFPIRGRILQRSQFLQQKILFIRKLFIYVKLMIQGIFTLSIALEFLEEDHEFISVFDEDVFHLFALPWIGDEKLGLANIQE
jgi:hypothetical protein